MSPTPPAEVKWDVASSELLRELIASPPPLDLRVKATTQSFHRDIYYDTADGSLARRDVTCRFRLGADDRRVLTVALAGSRQRFSSEVAELDLNSALRGESEAARRLRGLVDPATLEPLAELEVERTTRLVAGKWPWSGGFELTYDAVTVRHQKLSREFRELKLRRRRAGKPDLAAVAAAMRQVSGTRTILESKLARAQRLVATLEGEALARSLGTGRAVTLLALEGGALAFERKGDELTLPIADGQGEAASRHLLRATFGSAVGDLALLGTASGRGAAGRLQEVWVARRLRLDGEPADAIEWLPAGDVVSRAGSVGLQDPDTLAALAVAMRSDLFRTSEPPARVRGARTTVAPAVPPAEAHLLLDADLSTLEFQSRVMAMAEDPATPLLERLNFLAIVGSNLDEFYMVNVGALKEKEDDRSEARLEAIGIRVRALLQRLDRALADCLSALGEAGIRLRGWRELAPTSRALLEAQFQREIFPLLTPRAITVSPGFPVPVMPHLTLLLAVVLQDTRTGPLHFAYLRLPERLPRFLPVPDSNDLIRLEDVVRANLRLVYPDRQIEGAWLFRLTRAAELDLSDEDAGDLLQAIEESVGRRALNPIVRVEIEHTMPLPLRERLLWELRFERGAAAGAVREQDLVEIHGLLDPRSLRELMGAPVPGGRFPPLEGRNPWLAERDLWGMLRQRDALVYHPYDRFADTTVRFFADAADDPAVVAIRLTLYRVGERSPIVDALTRALERKKEVALFVELKARFDETRNVGWVRQLEEAGATVVYGVVGLKNHAKVGLVVRREEDGLRRYVHLGTGNYNAATAKVYTDLSLFSADPELGADVHDLFNQLTGSSRAPAGSFRRLAVAPEGVLPWLLERIEREIGHAQAGRGGRIRAKLNGIADTEVVQALYRASRAGVTIELIVRGICILRPGVSGHSERIRVVSRLGRFLEHARIYHFGNGGADEYFIGSADWRPRNLRMRVEVVAPVTEGDARATLDGLLTRELTDPEVWVLESDGSYHRAEPPGTT
ncbi:MAG TPA: polyphosphate kinase 1 [Gemmatimonadales bacterium]|jgi:polyphosphate kinase